MVSGVGDRLWGGGGVFPLTSICSRKCEMPFCSVDPRREPEPIQMPTDTLRTCGITSVITRTPLSSVLISISRKGLVGMAIAVVRKGPLAFVAPSGAWRGAPTRSRVLNPFGRGAHPPGGQLGTYS